MKLIRRAFYAFLLLCISLFVLKGWLYRSFVTYKSIGTRTSYQITNAELDSFFQTSSLNQDADIDEIINGSLQLTKERLSFVFAKSDTDPNKLFSSKKTHCVGYASFFTTFANSGMQKNKLGQNWEVEHHIGVLYLFGYNIHSYFNSPFFKDHDFVVITNKLTGETIAVDPTVYDYLRIKRVTYCN
jgi:hypothetical protein